MQTSIYHTNLHIIVSTILFVELVDPTRSSIRERVAIWHIRLHVENRRPIQQIQALDGELQFYFVYVYQS